MSHMIFYVDTWGTYFSLSYSCCHIMGLVDLRENFKFKLPPDVLAIIREGVFISILLEH